MTILSVLRSYRPLRLTARSFANLHSCFIPSSLGVILHCCGSPHHPLAYAHGSTAFLSTLSPAIRSSCFPMRSPPCSFLQYSSWSPQTAGALGVAGIGCSAKFSTENLSHPPKKIMGVLEEKVENLGSIKLAKLKELKKNHGDFEVSKCTVNSVAGGMRGLTSLITETSELDATRGITFRGYSIDDLQFLLPRTSTEQPPVEGLLWLLLTGEIPTLEEVELLSEEMHNRSTLIPEHTWRTIDSLPVDTHPMIQLSCGMLTLQALSSFSFAYQQRNISKKDYWKPMLQDAVSMLSKIPRVAAYIYRRTYKDGQIVEPKADLDWAGNFSRMMGYDTGEQRDFMRLFILLHADHEGGNVSAHASTLVGSALSDPYLAYTAGMTGLAGPLHGLANQECLNFLMDVKAKLDGQKPTKENVTAIVKSVLASGNVVPGYGHAVLRTTDPRYLAQRMFALRKIPHSELFRLLEVCYATIPDILKATGKVSNPYPNVDCHPGVLLQHYGITESSYYTVLFGVARAIGISSQLVWSRILGLPIERPKSTTIDALERKITESAK